VAWVRERTLPVERPLLVGEASANFADRKCRVVSGADPYGRILGFLGRSRYFFFQTPPQLYSLVVPRFGPDVTEERKWLTIQGLEPRPLDPPARSQWLYQLRFRVFSDRYRRKRGLRKFADRMRPACFQLDTCSLHRYITNDTSKFRGTR
jgi:hypothetical protein